MTARTPPCSSAPWGVRLLVLIVAVLGGVPRSAQDAASPLPTAARVALLGDSITAGARLDEARHHLGPRVEAYLTGAGSQARIEAFGAGGATLLRGTDNPYVDRDAWSRAQAFAPHVAVVVLGTNDTCLDDRRRPWDRADQLETDAAAMVGALREAGASRVLLCSPPPMLLGDVEEGSARHADLQARSARMPRIHAALQAVADRAGEGVRFVDLTRALRPGETLDGVHPSPFGADRLARRLATEVLLELEGGADPDLPLARVLSAGGILASADRWHGFRRRDFVLPTESGDGAACTLILPHAVRPGAPWIWRARFFGHEPALDLALLDAGFHVAYCEVGQLFGSARAVGRWERFHTFARELGLAERPVLEGMSRGGLPLWSYASRHPESVAALYGDNPVVDPRSWPGGRNGKRSDGDWAAYREAWSLSEEEAWQRDPLAAIDVRAWAARRVPLFLVVGADDRVVPVAENAAPLERAARVAGVDVTTWRKPGSGHHPHGLSPVDPLFRGLATAGLSANGQSVPAPWEPATVPLPSVEFRAGAGWNGGTWWDALDHLEAALLEAPTTPVVFLGDSITQGLTGHGDRLTRPAGTRAIDRVLGSADATAAVSLGLSGDRTEHLLFRIERPAFRALSPRVVVLQIGVNDVRSAGRTGRELADGIERILARLHTLHPSVHVIVCGPFPTGPTRDDPFRRRIDDAHALLRDRAEAWDSERVTLLDLRPLFLREDGTPNERLARDHVHVTGAGYEAWLGAIAPLVRDATAR